MRKVVLALNAAGEQRVSFIPVSGLDLTGCDWHPSLADDEKIAGLISQKLEATPAIWDKSQSAPAIGAVGASAQSTAPTGTPMTASERRAMLNRSLINDPSATWFVYGDQGNRIIKDGGPSGRPAVRTNVKKGANHWDTGASVPMLKPVDAGDVVLMAVYLRAPELASGQTTPVRISLNQKSCSL